MFESNFSYYSRDYSSIRSAPWTHNPSTIHIRIRIHSIHGIHLKDIVYCLNSLDLFLSVFGTEAIIYNNGLIDISDTF